MSFRDLLPTTATDEDRGRPRAFAALLAQRGTSRDDGLLAKAGLAISATATKFKTTLEAIVAIAGVVGAKAPTDNLVFSAAHTVTTAKYGVVLVQMTAAGVVSTKVPASPQAYASAALALAALPAADTGKQALGHIAVDNSAGGADWVANTNALTGVAAFTDARELGSEAR